MESMSLVSCHERPSGLGQMKSVTTGNRRQQYFRRRQTNRSTWIYHGARFSLLIDTGPTYAFAIFPTPH